MGSEQGRTESDLCFRKTPPLSTRLLYRVDGKREAYWLDSKEKSGAGAGGGEEAGWRRLGKDSGKGRNELKDIREVVCTGHMTVSWGRGREPCR